MSNILSMNMVNTGQDQSKQKTITAAAAAAAAAECLIYISTDLHQLAYILRSACTICNA